MAEHCDDHANDRDNRQGEDADATWWWSLRFPLNHRHLPAFFDDPHRVAPGPVRMEMDSETVGAVRWTRGSGTYTQSCRLVSSGMYRSHVPRFLESKTMETGCAHHRSNADA